MVRSPFLGDMLTTLFERSLSPSRLQSKRSIEDMCAALLAEEGEVSGIVLAKTILEKYASLGDAEKLAFFQFLNESLEINVDTVRQLAIQYGTSGAPEDYKALTASAEPARQELLRRLNQSTGATAALVTMRVDLLAVLKDHPDLKRTDLDFVHLLRSWFNRGFLVLRQISWDTPASVLEKIVAYEAVHAINDWDDLRRRLHPPDRRCFAYFHPTMPDEPLIFVEVALSKSVPSSIQHVLSEDREVRDAAETSVAVFYSISNCQAGLAGISFGNLLIKQVVDELSTALPDLKTFVTLSPIPGFNRWLATLTDDELATEVLEGAATGELIERFAAHYLLKAKSKDGDPLDPVARFHLGNGALIHATHANADMTDKGLLQSSGAMVNYLYDLKLIEKNHEIYVRGGDIPTSRGLKAKADLSSLASKRKNAP